MEWKRTEDDRAALQVQHQQISLASMSQYVLQSTVLTAMQKVGVRAPGQMYTAGIVCNRWMNSWLRWPVNTVWLSIAQRVHLNSAARLPLAAHPLLTNARSPRSPTH